MLKEGETLEDLQFANLKLIQHADLYRFTSDAVLLSSFVEIRAGERALEIGTGSGVISILCAKKTQAQHITAVEIQPVMADMARRSVALNALENTIQVECTSIQDFAEKQDRSYDVVFCNPPFKEMHSGAESLRENIRLSRHEACLPLSDLANCAARLLKYGGRFYMIHRADRMAEIFHVLIQNRLQPKTVRLIQSKPNAEPHIFLLKAVKNGQYGLRFLPTLQILDECGKETQEIRKIYNR